MIIASEYFPQSNTGQEFGLRMNETLDELKMVETDRKLTLPSILETIEPVDKLPLAGDIDTTSNNDLKYFFAIPLDDPDKLKKLMLYVPDTTPPEIRLFNLS